MVFLIMMMMMMMMMRMMMMMIIIIVIKIRVLYIKDPGGNKKRTTCPFSVFFYSICPEMTR